MKRRMMRGAVAGFVFLMGCQSAAVEKTTKPVLEPIRKTTEAVFQERKISIRDNTEAVIFPKEQEEETKHFKLKF